MSKTDLEKRDYRTELVPIAIALGIPKANSTAKDKLIELILACKSEGKPSDPPADPPIQKDPGSPNEPDVPGLFTTYQAQIWMVEDEDCVELRRFKDGKVLAYRWTNGVRGRGRAPFFRELRQLAAEKDISVDPVVKYIT